MTKTKIDGAEAWEDSANPGDKLVFMPKYGMLRRFPNGRWQDSWLGPLIEQIDEYEKKLPDEEAQELAQEYLSYIGVSDED